MIAIEQPPPNDGAVISDASYSPRQILLDANAIFSTHKTGDADESSVIVLPAKPWLATSLRRRS